MTSTRPADRSGKPGAAGTPQKRLSRKARLAAAKLAHEHALKNTADAAAPTGTVATAPVLPDPESIDAAVRTGVEKYTPLLAKRAAWDTNRLLAQKLVYAYGPRSARNARTVAAYLAGYIHWLAHRSGRDATIPLTATEVVVPHLFEEYLAASPWSDASRASTRSILRRIDARTRPHAAPVKLSHPKVAPPYSPQECDYYTRLAWRQPSRATQRRLGFIVALGLGAGLDATDMRLVRRRDLRQVDVAGVVLWVVTVHAAGARGRVVPVRLGCYPLLEQAVSAHDTQGLGPDDLLVENPSDQVSIISRVVTQARTAGSEQRVSLRVSRLRHTWLVDMMAAPVSLVDLMRAAGLRSGRSLSELVEHCTPADPTAVAELLASVDGHLPRSHGANGAEGMGEGA